VERPKVIVVTDEPEFFGTLTSCWSRERNMPVLLRKAADQVTGENFDLAIVGRLISPAAPVLESLRQLKKEVVYVSRANGAIEKTPGVVVLPETTGWPELVITVADQIMERERALTQIAKLQDDNSHLQSYGVLGQYMTDMRHKYNNALTSILGNCDLILLDAHQLPSPMKAQVETIRNMAMRLNEVFQRFSSLQKEMQLLEQQKKATAQQAGA
jgi:signal transduction histidine kinase